MKYVYRVTEKNERDVVIEVDNVEKINELPSIVDKDENFFNPDKVTRGVYYEDVTESYKENLTSEEFNALVPEFSFTEENTIRVRQITQNICELFEAILDKHDITIPDPDRNSYDEAARIYGETYFNLEDDITDIITEAVNRVKRKDIKVISDTY